MMLATLEVMEMPAISPCGKTAMILRIGYFRNYAARVSRIAVAAARATLRRATCS